MEIQEDVLEHHGIKGMKWGVRNAETQAKYAGGKGGGQRKSARSKAKAQKQQIKNIKRSRIAANKRRSTMSDQELNKRIARLQKEKQLRELTESEVTRGRSESKKFMKSQGKQTVAAVIAAGTTAALVKAKLK